MDRPLDLKKSKVLLEQFPVVAILGARQVGKTTLAQSLKPDHWFDLENPRDLSRLDQPQLALENLSGTIAIDEIQRKPDLFPLLRYLVDQKKDQKFLILGSASRDLIQQSSETLAGRIAYQYLSGFSLNDVGFEHVNTLWTRGGFPLSFLSNSDETSLLWRQQYIQTFLERDIPQLGINIPSPTLRRFWTMVSHYHGQVINYSELSRSFGMSDTTCKKYLDILAGTFMVRLLTPFHSNTKKRLVKSPKLYIRDSGIFHCLAQIENHETLTAHPKLGASWEAFVLESFTQTHELRDEDCFFWATHSGGEIDLYFEKSGQRLGLEMKYADAPRRTASMLSALKELNLDHLYVVYPGPTPYPLHEKITCLPLAEVLKLDL